eukprot:TRINITY_DN2819_c0_g1_i1.p1 TRINITY_DN2819_c0_g1~~TRINITY_DN2819_c0_g1_i1.p1  ORF type:complete len:863 (-),score=225.22 TRINITY_DN2819_c0_g1_i1:41-2581(-)
MSSERKVSKLPQSLQAPFKSILRFYDQKQYKKALKACELILKQFPTHGETLCQKGMVIGEMSEDKWEEAFRLVREGIRNDVRSHTSWQIAGIMYRKQGNYQDAARCYSQAHALNKGDERIMRELSTLLAQVRSYDRLLDIRREILPTKVTNQANWLSLAVSAHLAGDPEEAIKVLDSWLTTKGTLENKVELSEILLYKVQLLLEQQGTEQKALDFLLEKQSDILDKICFKLTVASIHTKLGENDKAVELYRELIKINPENWDYYPLLFKALGFLPSSVDSLRSLVEIDESQIASITTELAALTKLYPRAKPLTLIPLSYLNGDALRAQLRKVVYAPLTKGTPSLFASLKYLYKDEGRLQLVGDLMHDLEKSVLETNKFAAEETLEEPPTSIIWIYYFLAQHYNYLHRASKALSYLEKCLKHTPTCLDFHVMKARVYKDNGNVLLASQSMEYARTMDLADRYLNNKAVRYFLRANNIEKARTLLDIFTAATPSVARNERNNTNVMQVTWYQAEEANAYLRLGKYNMALKRFLDVEEHFQTFVNDEFDFHSYAIRKVNLRAYHRHILFDNSIRSHNHWVKAGVGLVKVYLHLLKESLDTSDPELEGLDETEKKKVLSKRKREAARLKREQEAIQAKLVLDIKKSTKIGYVDKDEFGFAVLENKDFAAEATKFVNYLISLSPSVPEHQLLAFEVFLVQGKYLLALRALNQLKNILPPNSPQLHSAVMKFAQTTQENPPTNSTVLEIVTSGLSKFVPSAVSLKEFNANYLAENSDCLAARVSFINSASPTNSVDLKEVIGSLPASTPLEVSIEAHKILVAADTGAEFFKECAKEYPVSSYFNPPTMEEED